MHRDNHLRRQSIACVPPGPCNTGLGSLWIEAAMQQLMMFVLGVAGPLQCEW